MGQQLAETQRLAASLQDQIDQLHQVITPSSSMIGAVHNCNNMVRTLLSFGL